MQSALDLSVMSRVVAAEAELDAQRLVYVFENGSFPDEVVNTTDLAVRGNQLASELQRIGIVTGDRVGVMMRNHPEFVYTYVATARLGAPAVPIDPRARGDKLAYFITFAECSVLLVADYVLADDAVADTIRKTGVRTYVLSTPEGRAAGIDLTGWASLNEVFDGPEAPTVREHVTDPTTPSLLGFTSGTTGKPKAIEFTHDRMLLYRRLPGFFGLQDDDVFYTGLSMTHGNAVIVTMMPPLWRAVGHSVFSRWFTRTRLWEICAEYGCTVWSNLGGIATALYSQPPSQWDQNNPVRLVVSAGMPRELWTPFEDRFGVRVCEWYGALEGGFAYNPVGVGPVGSFGKPPADLLRMEVFDGDEQPCASGEVGELAVRPVSGPARLTYYKNPEASANKVRDGWLRTGDLVYRDADGWLFFSHRKEEGGLRKLGEFISGSFIARVLAEHPGVLDVHIFGVPAKSGAPGEIDVVAAVVPVDAAAIEVAELFTLSELKLERSHIPDFIWIVDELPRTVSEKVQSRVLVDSFDDSDESVFGRVRTKSQG
ncbi:ATP-dependent acyl-CoA ligase [Saccharopolyspora karakumensis]|uniref:ATP-dependent acyl-CoA ligase n=1 Tax=Saccharopolyspora karakumensis TaxID=2530386 RepID=A0A4R5B8K8_9PSEU|nr:AMP-binding protein [Saccharopolyspora karakumensis]TDD81433.1 ATP-dependent acyl-CoA ligase [Saccharopolyspora karakumensis]